MSTRIQCFAQSRLVFFLVPLPFTLLLPFLFRSEMPWRLLAMLQRAECRSIILRLVLHHVGGNVGELLGLYIKGRHRQSLTPNTSKAPIPRDQ